MSAVIGLATAWKVLDGTSLCTAVEPVAIARCDTAVRDGVAVMFWMAREPLRRSSPRPLSEGRTCVAMNFSMNCGLAPSKEMRITRGTTGSCFDEELVEAAASGEAAIA